MPSARGSPEVRQELLGSARILLDPLVFRQYLPGDLSGVGVGGWGGGADAPGVGCKVCAMEVQGGGGTRATGGSERRGTNGTWLPSASSLAVGGRDLWFNGYTARTSPYIGCVQTADITACMTFALELCLVGRCMHRMDAMCPLRRAGRGRG